MIYLIIILFIFTGCATHHNYPDLYCSSFVNCEVHMSDGCDIKFDVKKSVIIEGCYIYNGTIREWKDKNQDIVITPNEIHGGGLGINV